MWEGSLGVERFLTGRDPPFCVVFSPVLFCPLPFPVVCFFSLHLITRVGVCCSVSLFPPSQPQTDSYLKMAPELSGWLSGGPVECRAGASLKDTFFSRRRRVASPLSRLNFETERRVGAPAPEGKPGLLRAAPPTCLVIAGGLGGDPATALLSSRHDRLHDRLRTVWSGEGPVARAGEAAAPPGRASLALAVLSQLTVPSPALLPCPLPGSLPPGSRHTWFGCKCQLC